MICTGKVVCKYENDLVLFLVDQDYYNDIVSFKQQYERDHTVYSPTIVARLNSNICSGKVVITKAKNTITRIIEHNNIKQKRICSPQYEIMASH